MPLQAVKSPICKALFPPPGGTNGKILPPTVGSKPPAFTKVKGFALPKNPGGGGLKPGVRLAGLVAVSGSPAQ